jgi:hypothetical protein
MAQPRVAALLEVEEPTPTGSTGRFARRPPIDSCHGGDQPVVGCAAHSRRTPETRHRRQSGHGREIHAPAPTTALSEVADVSHESGRSNRRGRLLRRADGHVSTPFRAGHPGARMAPGRTRGSNGPSDGGMDRPTIPRGVSGDEVQQYLIRDRDAAFAEIGPTAAGMVILTAPRSPWQNAYAERLIGSIRRECLDHVIAVNEIGLSRIPTRYVAYYHESRTHLSRDPRSARSSPFHRSAACTIATTVWRRSHTPPSQPGRRSPNGRRSSHCARTEHSIPRPHAPTPTRELPGASFEPTRRTTRRQIDQVRANRVFSRDR